MTDKIFAFVDSSTYAPAVCQLAGWLSSRLEMEVQALHVLRQGKSERHDLSGQIRLGARSRLLSELSELDAERARLAREQGRAILDDAAALIAQSGAARVTQALRQGDLTEAMRDVEAQARLFVLGKRGEDADLAEGHLGSNVERVLRASHRHVVVAAREHQPIRRVLLAWDGGASARRALELVATSPVYRGLSVQITHIGEGAAPGQDEAVARLQQAGLEVTSATLPGLPEHVLGRLVVDEGFDLVVMGAYGHSRIRSLVIGSTTTAMIRNCKVPVALIRHE